MRNIEVNRIYKHFKGDLYLVEGIATFSETGEKCIVYRELYGENNLWVRPYDMFVEEVPQGKVNPTGQKYRFECIQIKSVK